MCNSDFDILRLFLFCVNPVWIVSIFYMIQYNHSTFCQFPLNDIFWFIIAVVKISLSHTHTHTFHYQFEWPKKKKSHRKSIKMIECDHIWMLNKWICVCIFPFLFSDTFRYFNNKTTQSKWHSFLAHESIYFATFS